MKTIFRVLTILVVASVIAGGFYALIGGGSTSNSTQPSFQNEGQFAPDGDFQRPDGDRDEGDLGIALPFEMVKTGAIIAVITVIYLNAGKLFGKKKMLPTA